MKVYHALLSTPGSRHQDLGPDYCERQRDIARQANHHAGKLTSIGYKVTLQPIDPETGEIQPAAS